MKDRFIYTQLDEELIILDLDRNEYYSINNSGISFLQKINRDITLEKIFETMTPEDLPSYEEFHHNVTRLGLPISLTSQVALTAQNTQSGALTDRPILRELGKTFDLTGAIAPPSSISPSPG